MCIVILSSLTDDLIIGAVGISIPVYIERCVAMPSPSEFAATNLTILLPCSVFILIFCKEPGNPLILRVSTLLSSFNVISLSEANSLLAAVNVGIRKDTTAAVSPSFAGSMVISVGILGTVGFICVCSTARFCT